MSYSYYYLYFLLLYSTFSVIRARALLIIGHSRHDRQEKITLPHCYIVYNTTTHTYKSVSYCHISLCKEYVIAYMLAYMIAIYNSSTIIT